MTLDYHGDLMQWLRAFNVVNYLGLFMFLVPASRWVLHGPLLVVTA
jgi:hypothetical protein